MNSTVFQENNPSPHPRPIDVPSLITLTTDFGLRDWFVGTMKGVILGIAPTARIVDLSHEVPPGDRCTGAFCLASAHRYFPVGTVHVAVVDPGVGGRRTAIAVRQRGRYYVGPDNGVLTWALRGGGPMEVRALENEDLFLKPTSSTFHGRDIFGPIAAHLASGLAFSEVGPRLKTLARLPWPGQRKSKAGWQGRVVYIDRFGNAITSVRNPALPHPHPSSPPTEWVLKVQNRPELHPMPLVTCYEQGSGKPYVAVRGSSGWVEISVPNGNAASQLAVATGTKVTLVAQTDPSFARVDRLPSEPPDHSSEQPVTPPRARPPAPKFRNVF